LIPSCFNPTPETTNTSGLPEGRPLAFRNDRSIAVRTTVVVPVSIVVVVAVLLDDDGFVTIPAVPIPIMVAVTVAVAMNLAYGHAMGTDTDSDVFRAGRNCAADTDHGGYGECVLNHCVLLSM
jgi:uncharacterized membrane protein YkvI